MPNTKYNTPEIICFSGSGVRLLAYAPAYGELLKHGYIDQEKITAYYGNSGGAIIATLLAIGYNHIEIEKRKLEPNTKFPHQTN